MFAVGPWQCKLSVRLHYLIQQYLVVELWNRSFVGTLVFPPQNSRLPNLRHKILHIRPELIWHLKLSKMTALNISS